MHLTRAVRLVAVVVAATALASLSGLLPVATSEAQQPVQVSCPAGWTPSADGTMCLSDAVDDNVTTTTSCTQGVLSADGQFCIVPRLDAAPGPAPATPADDVQAPVPTFTG